jgi:hypothetical protein
LLLLLQNSFSAVHFAQVVGIIIIDAVVVGGPLSILLVTLLVLVLVPDQKDNRGGPLASSRQRRLIKDRGRAAILFLIAAPIGGGAFE